MPAAQPSPRGNSVNWRAFDALDLDHEPDPSPRRLAGKLRDLLVRGGFLDAEVTPELRGGPDDRVHVLELRVRERPQVRVVAREYPCLAGGPLTPADLSREIDGFLADDLPGGVVGAPDPAEVDALLGEQSAAGERPRPADLAPARTLAEATYDRALKHVAEYLRSEGHLSATVGPLQVIRRACARSSPPGTCVPVRADPPPAVCAIDAQGLPVDEPPLDPAFRCTPDPAAGVACEPRVTLRVPVKLGPRTTLWDLAFEGGDKLAALRARPGCAREPGAPGCGLVERDLARVAGLTLGDPVSQVGVEDARRRLRDAIREQGFAFADVRASLEFSPDRTRARARFAVAEGERIVVDGVVVRGARRTDPALVLSRTTFAPCPPDRAPDACVPFRPSDVRESEANIAALGVFSSVSIALEDETVPARRKVVVVSVQERLPQYLDIRPGFSTGEGFRTAFEYGHGNVGGKAIQLVFRVQLAYLPDPFILDRDVRKHLGELPLGQRLGRRNTVSVVFPEVGLGPRVRLGVDGVDVRDNARDYGLSKNGLVGTLTWRGTRAWRVQAGGSLERNDVRLFNGDSVESYLQTVGTTGDVARLLRVPDGTTLAVGQRVAATWDARDRPLGATRGALLVAAAEHVDAFPIEDNASTTRSHFVRLSSTVAAYAPLGRKGTALAASIRAKAAGSPAAARAIVKRVEKSGELAADVVKSLRDDQISNARFSFLDLDAPASVTTEAPAARGLDLPAADDSPAPWETQAAPQAGLPFALEV
jgi:hypothetical protein